MPRVILVTSRVTLARRSIDRSAFEAHVADCVISISPIASLDRAREAKMLADMDPELDAYEIYSNYGKRVFMFAKSEREVLDRLVVASVLL